MIKRLALAVVAITAGAQPGCDRHGGCRPGHRRALVPGEHPTGCPRYGEG